MSCLHEWFNMERDDDRRQMCMLCGEVKVSGAFRQSIKARADHMSITLNSVVPGDIFKLGCRLPAVKECLVYWEMGKWSWEQAMMMAVKLLAEENERLKPLDPAEFAFRLVDRAGGLEDLGHLNCEGKYVGAMDPPKRRRDEPRKSDGAAQTQTFYCPRFGGDKFETAKWTGPKSAIIPCHCGYTFHAIPNGRVNVAPCDAVVEDHNMRARIIVNPNAGPDKVSELLQGMADDAGHQLGVPARFFAQADSPTATAFFIGQRVEVHHAGKPILLGNIAYLEDVNGFFGVTSDGGATWPVMAKHIRPVADVDPDLPEPDACVPAELR